MKVPRLPKGEQVWASCYSANNELCYIITSKVNQRDYYYLYNVEDGELKKLGKARSPLELEEKYEVKEKLGWRGE